MKNIQYLILASTLVASCGGTSSNSSEATNDKKNSTITKVDKKPAHACKILESSIKSSFSDAKEMEVNEDFLAKSKGDDYIPKKCGYRFNTQNAAFDAYIELWKVHSKYATGEALMKKVSYMNAKKTEEVSGIGEKAFSDTISNRFVAMNNKSIIATVVRCVGSPQCKEGRAINKTLTNGIFVELDKL